MVDDFVSHLLVEAHFSAASSHDFAAVLGLFAEHEIDAGNELLAVAAVVLGHQSQRLRDSRLHELPSSLLVERLLLLLVLLGYVMVGVLGELDQFLARLLHWQSVGDVAEDGSYAVEHVLVVFLKTDGQNKEPIT